MSRWPRLVVPSVAVHVIQRGNNRQLIFFATDDFARIRTELVRAESSAIVTAVTVEALSSGNEREIAHPAPLFSFVLR